MSWSRLCSHSLRQVQKEARCEMQRVLGLLHKAKPRVSKTTPVPENSSCANPSTNTLEQHRVPMCNVLILKFPPLELKCNRVSGIWVKRQKTWQIFHIRVKTHYGFHFRNPFRNAGREISQRHLPSCSCSVSPCRQCLHNDLLLSCFSGK